MVKHSNRILDLAKRGAKAQLRDLLYEAQMLLQLFPDLQESFDKDELPLNFIMAESSGAVVKKPGRKPMSAAAKKAVSARMKKYWAAKRKAEQK